jgi:hypothetical protein
MWTQGKSKLAIFGASVVFGALAPPAVAFAADLPVPAGSDSSQVAATSTNDLPTVVAGSSDTADRTYTAVSNILKTKHDTVKNSISNIR